MRYSAVINKYDLNLQNGSRWSVNMQAESPYATSHLLVIAIFAYLPCHYCEIIIYELLNVLDSNFWPWKWRSTTLTLLMKIDRRTLSTCKTKLALQPFVTFHDRRVDDVHPYSASHEITPLNFFGTFYKPRSRVTYTLEGVWGVILRTFFLKYKCDFMYFSM